MSTDCFTSFLLFPPKDLFLVKFTLVKVVTFGKKIPKWEKLLAGRKGDLNYLPVAVTSKAE